MYIVEESNNKLSFLSHSPVLKDAWVRRLILTLAKLNKAWCCGGNDCGLNQNSQKKHLAL